jgi:hypothetical protein
MSSSSASSSPAARAGADRRRQVVDFVAQAEAARAAVAAVGGLGTVASPPSGEAFETPVGTGSSGVASRDGLAGECIICYLDDVLVLSGVCVPGGLPSLLGEGRVVRRGLLHDRGVPAFSGLWTVEGGGVNAWGRGGVPRCIAPRRGASAASRVRLLKGGHESWVASEGCNMSLLVRSCERTAGQRLGDVRGLTRDARVPGGAPGAGSSGEVMFQWGDGATEGGGRETVTVLVERNNGPQGCFVEIRVDWI